jgi:hypothetical protein
VAVVKVKSQRKNYVLQKEKLIFFKCGFGMKSHYKQKLDEALRSKAGL